MNQTLEAYTDAPALNPLDSVEDVLRDNNWIYSRMNNDELLVDIKGSVFGYRLFFAWQEHMNAMQIVCQMDCTIPEKNLNLAMETLMNVNRSMWMGHFELSQDSNAPCFRYTCLLHERKSETNVYANVQDIVDICMAQCEQHQTVFQMLSSEENVSIPTLSLAMMETVGES